MALTVFSESIDTYARSPNENDNYLAHYGVKGMRWGQHQQGKWQNHAVYAQGDWRHTDGTPRTKYEGRKEEIKEFLKGKKGSTPRTDISNLSDEEIQARINRLKKENDLLQQMQNQRKYDQYFINETKKIGILDTLNDKIISTTGNASKRIATAGGYKIAESLLGEDAAKMIFFNEKPKKDKKNDNKKDKPFDAAEDLQKRMREKREGIIKLQNESAADKKIREEWEQANPGKPYPLDKKSSDDGNGNGNSNGGNDGGNKKKKKSGGNGSSEVEETVNMPMKDLTVRLLFDKYDKDDNGLLDVTEVDDAWNAFMGNQRYHSTLDKSITNEYQDIINDPSYSSSTSYSSFMSDIYNDLFK